MKEELIIKAAIDELLNPRFAITEQYLAVNKVVYENDLPLISRVDEDDDHGLVTVYFPIEGERYFLAVHVDTEPDVCVRWIETEPGNRVYLVVSSKTLELDELIKRSGVEPSESWKKGEEINKKRLYEDNGFIYEPNPERADDFEDKLDKLLATLENLKENIINLSRVVELQINIAYYGYKEQMWGWHLDLKTLKKLAELKIEVDFDIYAGGPDLPY